MLRPLKILLQESRDRTCLKGWSIGLNIPLGNGPPIGGRLSLEGRPPSVMTFTPSPMVLTTPQRSSSTVLKAKRLALT